MTLLDKIKDERGFTLQYFILIIVILSVIAGVAINRFEQSVYQSRINKTLDKIESIQYALYGDHDLRDQTSFGYIGDMEKLPKKLDYLIDKPGGGKTDRWDGPYLTREFLEDNSDPFLDAWGNPILYDASTGQLVINPESIGDDQVIIPQPFDNIDDILYGGIEGIIRDSNGDPPPKGHRRHIYIVMTPLYSDSFPDIAYDLDMDRELFHMHRIWALHNTLKDGIDKFCDPIDSGRRHWTDKPAKNYWRWLPEGVSYEIQYDDYDDHETEYDSLGTRRYFDPHFEEFWDDYYYSTSNKEVYEQITVFIHPDRYGEFSTDKIPVKPYLITCYHDYYELSIKRYVIIKSNRIEKVNFRFQTEFDK
ncbi:MAG: hypothetical protein GY863_21265 [bacterium]|nr:hypothetical protein [bacterium]